MNVGRQVHSVQGYMSILSIVKTTCKLAYLTVCFLFCCILRTADTLSTDIILSSYVLYIPRK